MSIFTPNKTSARLLVDYAAELWGSAGEGEGDTAGGSVERRRRYLLVYDLYIKARSYALVNKVTFWLSVLFGLLVVVWPSVAILADRQGGGLEFLGSAVIQTTVTAAAALAFAVYSHYKKRQMLMENLMRQVVYSDEPTADVAARIVSEMERIDAGFSFSEAVLKKKPGGGPGEGPGNGPPAQRPDGG